MTARAQSNWDKLRRALGTHSANPSPAVPVIDAPFGYVNTQTGQFFKDVEPSRKGNEGHWRTVYLNPSPTVPAKAITAQIMQDDGGDQLAFCVMVAYRSQADAMSALALLAAPPQALPTPDAARWRLIAKHWKTVDFKFDKAGILSGLTLTVNLKKSGNGAALDIERELDAAIAAQADQKGSE